jgi:hypothetical protein
MLSTKGQFGAGRAIVGFARSINCPPMFGLKEFAIPGGLMSYGASFLDPHYGARS